MTNEDTRSGKHIDPAGLGLVGEIADLLGLVETVQRILGTPRRRAERRHRRVEKLLDDFHGALSDTRAALRVLVPTLEQHLPSPEGAEASESLSPNLQLPRIAFSIPGSEFPIYRRGIDQLQTAIKKLTKIAFDLEATSAGVPEEVQRYYRISEVGNSVLRQIKRVLDDHLEELPDLVREIDFYAARCSTMLEERKEWIQS